ncbi:MAG: HAD-IA family hydrolase [Firmicutes bacterium]|nr:HAD-IA family hydrolase [Bacillota bacterium]
MSRNLYIFDCFGVVVSEVSTLWMKPYLNDEQQEYMRKSVFRRVDVGEIAIEEVFTIAAEKFNLDADELARKWTECEYVKEDTLNLLAQLRKQGHCVALLSNASRKYIDYLFARFDLYKYFDKIFVSADYGVAKPDREFYKLCVDDFDEQFGVKYFADDRAENLIGLEQFGITPILFTSADEFAQKVGLKK